MSRRSTIILTLMIVCYGYVLPRWADWSQTSRLALVRALVEQGTPRIDAYVGSTGDYAFLDGHAYSDKAPGPALLAAPFYAILWPVLRSGPARPLLDSIARRGPFAATLNPGGAGLGTERVAQALSQYLLTLIAIALPSALAVAALDWLLRRWFASGPALLGSLGYGLATPATTYAGNFYSHALAAALLIGAWSVIEGTRSGRSHWAVRLSTAGLLLGWATISEYPAAVLCGILAIYAIHHCGWQAAIWLAVGALPALLVLVVYDLVAFQTPWPVGYAHSALWHQQHDIGFVSLTYPHLGAIWGLLASPFRGLFLRSPWLLLSLGCCSARQVRALRWPVVVAVSAAASLCLVYSSSVMWWGGFAAGPRYIIPAMPFLTVLSVCAIDRMWTWTWSRWLAVGLVVLSCLLVWAEALAGQQFPPDTISNPWLAWTVPAWQRADIARNAGMAFGLRGVWSLLPLVTCSAILVLHLTRLRQRPDAVPHSHPLFALR